MELNAVLPFSFWISVNDTLAKSKDTDDKAAFYTSLHCFKDIKNSGTYHFIEILTNNSFSIEWTIPNFYCIII